MMTKKIGTTLLLAALSTGVMAEWTQVGNSDGITIYADPTTIRKNGHMVKMWYLFDESTPQSIPPGTPPFSSTKFQGEFDCAEERSRRLYSSYHSDQMGAGSVVDVNASQRQWTPVSPESIIEALWKVACHKK